MSFIDMNEKYSKPSYRWPETTFSRDLGPFSSISARARSAAAFLFFDKKNAALLTTSPPPHTLMAALWCLNCVRA